MQNVQTLKGFRDFIGVESKKRLWLIEKIRTVFERFGFEPLETPTLEYESVIMGKYGAEADKLVYSFEDRGKRRVALRYDQTVPTARVISQYKNTLVFPFKRYQIQPVWRADKPQKGRYREFYQCDIDIFGSASPIADAEIIAGTFFAFKEIGFPSVKILLNDRQLLFNSLKKYANDKISVLSIIQTIDKVSKIGDDGVILELTDKGISQNDAKVALSDIQNTAISSNLSEIIEDAVNLGVLKNDLVFTPTLARGLDYYTGMIFEILLPGYEVGSVGGGGRYDKLIGQLGDVDIPAVGVALGFDRMVDAAEQFELIDTSLSSSQVLVTIFSDETMDLSLQVVAKLRSSGIRAEVFPDLDKLDKQLKYASKKQVPFVVVIGPEEKEKNVVKLKNMQTGEQESLSIDQAIKKLK
jgi:histidyl-tRNA synthetase